MGVFETVRRRSSPDVPHVRSGYATATNSIHDARLDAAGILSACVGEVLALLALIRLLILGLMGPDVAEVGLIAPFIRRSRLLRS